MPDLRYSWRRMRLLPIIKELPIPAILGTGIYAGVTGDLPLVGSATDLPLTNLDIWVFENTKYPALFLTFSGMTLVWIIYLVRRVREFINKHSPPEQH